MEVKIPETVNVVELETAPFNNALGARCWSIEHGIVGLMSDVDTCGKGDVSISVGSIRKMVSGSALEKSVTHEIHYAALVRLRDIIRESFVAEIHPDYTKVDGKRAVENPINDKLEIVVLYGAVSFGGFAFRVKTTLKLYHEPGHPNKAYSYEVCNIEVIKGNEILKGIRRASARPNDRISMSVGILLNGVCDVNGAPLLAVGGGLPGCRVERTGESAV